MTDRPRTLEIESPTARCSACGFTSTLEGEWSVENGRLIWRGDPELQTGRGPDLFRCAESHDCGNFGRVTVDSEALSAEQLDVLRETAWPGYREKWRP